MPGEKKIAVVGSGLAGLVAAYLLQHDEKHRYTVVVFESGSAPSLDAASVNIEDDINGGLSRVDVPMRAFTGGYYRNLVSMYNYLGIQYRRQKFRFVFSRAMRGEKTRSDTPYFIHASDNHEVPPPRPRGVGYLAYTMELLFVIFCFAWLTICCYLVPTSDHREDLRSYLGRISLPGRFLSDYFLPLMSAVATCSHEEMLRFPASDVVGYRKLITGQRQYVVRGGVGQVQTALTEGLDVRTGVRITRVEPGSRGVEAIAETLDEKGQVKQVAEKFDQVVLAVPPTVAAAIFEPASKQMAGLPTRRAETIVHRAPRDPDAIGKADQILLKTSAESGGWTQATHMQSCGVGVTSCPMTDSCIDRLISRSTFVRTLRTPESRQIVEKTFFPSIATDEKLNESKFWRNGDQGVWMVGAWCWDGMVLLEGAVVSSMRVAKALGVEIPW